MTQVPYSDLTSYYVNRPDRRAVDLREAGVPEGIVLGRSLYRSAYPPLPPHRHFGVAELAYIETGHQPYDIGGQRLTLLGGEGAVIPPDTPHSSDGHPSYPGKRFWLQLRLPDRPGRPWLGLSAKEAAPLLRMLRAPANPCSRWPANFSQRASALFDLYDQPPSPTRAARLRTALLTLLFDLLDLNVPDAAPAYQTRVRKAIGWAESRPEKAPTLEELATVAGLSVSSFKRVFKEVAGIPPHAYLLRRRIERAQSRLRKGDRTVTEVAFECGFPSSQYFATVFKRVTGLTPNDVLRNRVAPFPADGDGQ
jgi:AraC-like DNA-binding protein